MAISYFGGKNNMVEWINPFIPRDIKRYCEPFSGAFWVYINLKYQFPELDKIVYNDVNGHMANLFACLSKPDIFLEKLEYALSEDGFLYTKETEKDKVRDFYKEIYYRYKHDKSDGNFLDNPPQNIPDFDAGVIYSFLITSAFNGCWVRSAGCSPISTNLKPKLTALVNKLKKQEYIDKLVKITDVHNEDFEEIFKKYDSEDTFFYVDPPYFSPGDDGKDTAKRASWYGTKDFNYDSHMRILNVLKNCKGRWALSYYYFKELEDLLPKDEYVWVSKDYYRSSASFAESAQEKGTELLIMNYELSDEEIEENKKFLNVKPTRKKVIKKSIESDVTKIIKNEVDEFLDFEEELLDSSEKQSDVIVKKISELISKQTDIDSEFVDIVNENFDELIDNSEDKLTEEELIDEIEDVNDGAFIVSSDSKKIDDEDDIDDFWTS